MLIFTIGESGTDTDSTDSDTCQWAKWLALLKP